MRLQDALVIELVGGAAFESHADFFIAAIGTKNGMVHSTKHQRHCKRNKKKSTKSNT
jgi:hypothetical protein